MDVNSSIRSLKGIGEKTYALFSTLGIETVRDLLMYFPHRYDTYPEAVSPEAATEEEWCAVRVSVGQPVTVNQRSRLKTAVLEIPGGKERLKAVWFRFPYIRSVLKKGSDYVLYGRVTRRNGSLFLDQPKVFSPEQYASLAGTMQPVYPLTKGLKNAQLTKAIRQCLDQCDTFCEYLPDQFRLANHLAEYNYALNNIHFPIDLDACIKARQRFIFDEFLMFILQMKLASAKSGVTENQYCPKDSKGCLSIAEQLPFALTNAQKRALDEIVADLNSPRCMQRLLQGDVGCGKTVLAFLAMTLMAKSGYQSALMAPTEVLAGQHYRKLLSFTASYAPEVPVILLTGSLTAKQRKEALASIREHDNAMIVGTHALISGDVDYRRLALAVTDEQHRFGVRQRELFAENGQKPHILIMSATPIPRTLAIILYGGLDVTVIDEVPAKRLPVKNCVVPSKSRPAAWRFIEEQVKAGHQAYVICPLVEASEGYDGENVTDYAKKLADYYGDRVRIGVLHGRMRPAEKTKVMEAFLAHETDVLVSTTVVEVGVDVPNATVMMVEDAQNFGLAQLHQLRGRIGRGSAQSYCIFLQGKGALNENPRLAVLKQSNDGFAIAREDLKLRGPGDFFGIRQSGEFAFKIGDIYRDMELLTRAAEAAAQILTQDPDLSSAEYARLAETIESIRKRPVSEISL